MRLIWVCALCLAVFAEPQKTQIIQTYIYQVGNQDVKQEFKDGILQIKILSKSLLEFLDSKDLEGKMERQVVRFNHGYTEFSASEQNIQGYSNVLNTKLKFNLKQMIYDLDYMGNGVYIVKNAIEPFREITKCYFMIQKSLATHTNKRKDFVINLDYQRFFGNVLATHKYLQCMRV